jgi:hypothetical protein
LSFRSGRDVVHCLHLVALQSRKKLVRPLHLRIVLDLHWLSSTDGREVLVVEREGTEKIKWTRYKTGEDGEII